MVAQVSNSVNELEDVVKSLDIDDVEPSESDTDSASTPAGSPSQSKARMSDKNRHSTQSFGLHSPDGITSTSCEFQVYPVFFVLFVVCSIEFVTNEFFRFCFPGLSPKVKRR